MEPRLLSQVPLATYIKGLKGCKMSEVWLFDTRAMTLTRVTTATHCDADFYSSDLDWEKLPAGSILDPLVPISILLTIRLGGTIV